MDPSKTTEEQQQAFAKMLDKAVKDSLKGVDKARAALEKERNRVARELEAAQKARKKAEQAGEKLAQAYFEKQQQQLIESARTELLRDLARRHLEAGKSVEDICHWLNVEKSFVEKILEIIRRVAQYHRSAPAETPIKPDNTPRLQYSSQGRSGLIRFSNNLTSFDLWWEFGGGNALALIDIPSEKDWETITKIPLAKRDETLRFIAEQVIQDQASGNGTYSWDDRTLTIYQP